MKINDYDGRILTNAQVSYKIDGVCAIWDGVCWLSRKGKPLYNLPTNMAIGCYEVFLGNWSDSVSACRTHNGQAISPIFLYRLDRIDYRLLISPSMSIDQSTASTLLQAALALNYEGVVFANSQGLFKLKPIVTYDETVIGYRAGTGKHYGRMGALITTKGKVGTGFSDKEREQFHETFIVGKVIEVEAMSLTLDGKFRHPRFIRLREDK